MTEVEDDYVVKCGNCLKVVTDDDPQHVCLDGDPIFCADCAPTWADGKAQWEETTSNPDCSDDDRALAGCFQKRFDAHIAAGGSPTDKWLNYHGAAHGGKEG